MGQRLRVVGSLMMVMLKSCDCGVVHYTVKKYCWFNLKNEVTYSCLKNLSSLKWKN